MSLNIILDTGTHKIESAGVKATPAPQSKITKLAFKMRFTDVERKTIRAAAKVNEDIEDFWDLVKDANYIDLSLQEVINGVKFLETSSLLVAGRANEILTNPVQAHEIP